MLYTAIFLLSVSSLSFEVMLTRFFLISQWSHLSFMVISIALLGYAASGRFSHRLSFRLRHRLGPLPQFSPERSGIREETLVKLLLLIYSIVAFSSYFLLNLIPMDFFRIMVERIQFFYLAVTYLILSVPFFITGLAISMAYSLNPEDSGKIYLINMTASALGVALPFLLLGIIGEGGMIIGSALLPVAGLFVYRYSFKSGFPKLLIEIGGILTLATALIAFSALHDRLSVFRVSPYKALTQILKFPDTKVIRRIVNIRERVDLLKSPYVRFAPGLSLKYGEAISGKEAVVMNGDTVVSLYDMGGVKRNLKTLSGFDFPRYTLSFTGYLLANKRKNNTSRALVIETGGGLAVLTAAAGGAKHIDVLVNSKGLYDILSEYTGIKIILENPRAFLLAFKGNSPAHSSNIENRYDVIQVENWGSSIPGMASSNEEPLFTVDAFTSYLRILSRTGVLIISRKLLLPPSDSLRLFLTALESLAWENRKGTKTLYGDAADHIAVMRNWDTFTMLVSKEPLSGNDISLLKGFAERMNFDFVYYPGIKREEVNRFNVYDEPYFYNAFKKFLDASDFKSNLTVGQKISQTSSASGSRDKKDYYKLLNSYYLDIKPQYDNRPFQNRFVRLRGISDYFKATGSRPYKLLMSGEVVVIAVFAEALVLSLLILFFPGRKITFLPGLYFFFVGCGFMFIEMGLIKMFTMVTGNPVVSFTMILSVILVFSGLGGKVSDWIKKPAVFIMLLIAQVFLLFLGYSGILHYLLSLSKFLRFALSIVLLIPISFLIGFPFPVGMRCMVMSSGQRSYAWAVNGVSSVLAAVISEYIASSMGIDVLILAGIVSYLVVFSLLYLILAGQRIKPPC